MSEVGSAREPGVTGFAFDLVPRTLCHERSTLRSWCLFMQKRLRMGEYCGARELDVGFRWR